MKKQEIFEQIKRKESYLCVGLDTDINKIPKHLIFTEADPVFAFNKAIITATIPYAVAYKFNFAFYESSGVRGMISLQKTMDFLQSTFPEVFAIADAKRGDIGNTSTMYAKAVFNKESSGFNFDAITVAPYMGEDSVAPFLQFDEKWAIVLALTSNKGAADFQWYGAQDGGEWKNTNPLFWEVIKKSRKWGTDENMMYVVGATKAEYLEKIREIVPNHFLLVPGVGAQGGNLEEVSKYGMNKECGLLVNNSRSIIYASTGTDFAKAAGQEAAKMQYEMKGYLHKYL